MLVCAVHPMHGCFIIDHTFQFHQFIKSVWGINHFCRMDCIFHWYHIFVHPWLKKHFSTFWNVTSPFLGVFWWSLRSFTRVVFSYLCHGSLYSVCATVLPCGHYHCVPLQKVGIQTFKNSVLKGHIPWIIDHLLNNIVWNWLTHYFHHTFIIIYGLYTWNLCKPL